MKKTFMPFLLIHTAALQAQTFSPETESLRLFEKYKPTIEKANNAIAQPPTVITGDLNSDGLTDCLLFFVLTPKEGGNAVLDRQTAVYINNGQSMKIGGAFPQVNFCYVPTKIEAGIVYADEYICPPPYNDKKGTRKFKYRNGKIVTVK